MPISAHNQFTNVYSCYNGIPLKNKNKKLQCLIVYGIYFVAMFVWNVHTLMLNREDVVIRNMLCYAIRYVRVPEVSEVSVYLNMCWAPSKDVHTYL